MLEPNDLDTLVALRILIEALRLYGAAGPPEDQDWEEAGRKTRQAKDVVGFSDRSR